MKRPNINITRRVSDPKIIGIFFGVFIGVIIIFLFSVKQPGALSEKVRGKEGEKGEVLGREEVSEASPTESPTPTPTPPPEAGQPLAETPTPTPTPTPDSADTSQAPQSPNTGSQPDPGLQLYSGPPLEPAPYNKDLLIISDSMPQDWVVDKNEGTSFVSGKIGQGLQVEENGVLELSGGEVFVASGTLSFWLKPAWDTSAGGERPIIAWGNIGENQGSLFELSAVGDSIYFSIYHEGNQFSIGGGKKIDNFNDWHHIIVTWDFTKEPFERKLFVDGKVIDKGGLFASVAQLDNSRFVIGGDLFKRNSVSFLADELVLTNWAKTEEEIL